MVRAPFCGLFVFAFLLSAPAFSDVIENVSVLASAEGGGSLEVFCFANPSCAGTFVVAPGLSFGSSDTSLGSFVAMGSTSVKDPNIGITDTIIGEGKDNTSATGNSLSADLADIATSPFPGVFIPQTGWNISIFNRVDMQFTLTTEALMQLTGTSTFGSFGFGEPAADLSLLNQGRALILDFQNDFPDSALLDAGTYILSEEADQPPAGGLVGLELSNEVSWTATFTSIPEPSSLLFSTIGLIFVCAVVWYRRKSMPKPA